MLTSFKAFKNSFKFTRILVSKFEFWKMMWIRSFLFSNYFYGKIFYCVEYVRIWEMKNRQCHLIYAGEIYELHETNLVPNHRMIFELRYALTRDNFPLNNETQKWNCELESWIITMLNNLAHDKMIHFRKLIFTWIQFLLILDSIL